MNLGVKCRRFFATAVAATILYLTQVDVGMGQESYLIIDDRAGNAYSSSLGSEWRLVTDGVMGGISTGKLSPDDVADRPCLRLTGDVSLANNGGFVQVAMDMPGSIPDLESYTGLMLDVYGNSESYNVHLRTTENRLPWQSYRATFTAIPTWTQIKIPFESFKPYRTDSELNIRNLKRIGIVAIGREFSADVCLGGLALYR